MKHTAGVRIRLLAAASLAALMGGAPALAQGGAEAAREVIVVTATKKANVENVQDVPIAVTAYGEAQLDALHVRDLQSLSYEMPNVSLEDVVTSAGYANFSIRGLGINSSIPSVDPTVGVFVDGMYYAINAGVLFDNFDLEGIEVLRGPQGILFGRNVTGGAVLLRTTTPGNDFEFNGKLAVETGLNKIASMVVSGPIVHDVLAGKFAIYHNDDEGWFDNIIDTGTKETEEFGANEQTIVRGALALTPSDGAEFIVRVEHGEAKGDGPAAQNRAIWDRNSFDFSVDERGFYDNTWNQAIFETNIDVPLGDGVITNILGWREYKSRTRADIDGLLVWGFHAPSRSDSRQLSNELRYAGTFGNADVTTGLYFLTTDGKYIEKRELSGGLANFTGGGVQEASTWAVFGAVDYGLTETLTLNLGFRYTEEEKEASVNNLVYNLCDLATYSCDFTNVLSFNDKDSWNNFSPKIGFQWEPNEDTQIYGFWVKAFRSGGYNFRNTPASDPMIDQSPGPTDPEEVSSFEVGLKKDFARARFNGAVFYNEIENMQREINLPGPIGVAQFIRNTADATIMGAEFEAAFYVTDNVLLQAHAGYTDASYDKVLLDLSGDGVVDGTDLALDIPRVAPWTYGLGVVADKDVGAGVLTGRVGWNHRDASAYTDSNVGTLNPADMVDASIALGLDSGLTLSVFGKNLLNEVTEGNETILPASLGGPGATFAPLNRGQIIGMELQFKY